MRIALVNLGRSAAGPIYALEIARRLAGHASLLCVISRHAHNVNAWRASGLRVVEVDTYTDRRSFVLGTLDVRRHLQIRTALRRFRPDVIYYPMIHPWYPIVGWVGPRVPAVLTLHDPVLHEGERNLAVDQLQRIVTAQAARVIVLSGTFVDVVARRGIPRDCIDVIPLGDTRGLGALEPLAHEPGPPTLLFFGRILAYKGLDTLLEAFSVLKGSRPDARLIIAGPGDLGPYRKQLGRLTDVVLDNRWVPDDQLGSHLRQANVVVLPYRTATQSAVIPVAYAFRLPVVATAVGGLVDQVRHGETGLLVPPNDPHRLAESIARLLDDPGLTRSMGNTGHDLVAGEWSWARISEQIATACYRAVRPTPR